MAKLFTAEELEEIRRADAQMAAEDYRAAKERESARRKGTRSKNAEYVANWRRKNKARSDANNKRYYQEHKEKIKANSRAYYQANRDKILAKAKARSRERKCLGKT